MKNEHYKVLLVEDDEDDYFIVRKLLETIPFSTFHLDWAQSYEAGLEKILANQHHVCLLDYQLQEKNGLEFMWTAFSRGSRVPIIFLTGVEDRALDMEAMERGASDYLVKGQITRDLLDRSIRYTISHKRAEGALRASEDRCRSIFEKSLCIKLIVDPESRRIIEANSAAAQFYGYSLEELQGLELSRLNFMLPEQICREIPGKECDNPTETTEQHRLASGELRDIEVHSSPIEYRGKKLLHSIIHDVTERKQMQKVLLQSQAELKFLSSKLLSLQEEERARIAQELHDTISQSLAATKLGIETAINLEGKGKTRSMAEMLNPFVGSLRLMIEDVRRIYMGLRPTVLDDFGIEVATGWLCREFTQLHPSIRIEKDIRIQETVVPPSLKTTIFRVMQEALENVAKHSQASEVCISLLTTDTGSIELSIQDNGVGFSSHQNGTGEKILKGFGLPSMKERVESSGGAFHLRSSKTAGTLIRAGWPG
jgi:PAS domain S-box-containing protein